MNGMLEVIVKNESDIYEESILEEGVEFIGLINKQGKMENTIFKNEFNLTKERMAMLSMELRLQSSMQSDFDSEFGLVSFNVTEREKLKFVTMTFFPYVVLAVMKKDIDHIPIIDKINKNIQRLQGV